MCAWHLIRFRAGQSPTPQSVSSLTRSFRMAVYAPVEVHVPAIMCMVPLDLARKWPVQIRFFQVCHLYTYATIWERKLVIVRKKKVRANFCASQGGLKRHACETCKSWTELSRMDIQIQLQVGRRSAFPLLFLEFEGPRPRPQLHYAFRDFVSFTMSDPEAANRTRGRQVQRSCSSALRHHLGPKMLAS
jgi:hypothetical protein